MHMNVDISIIVPFYNVEKYIERCLDSIVHQTFYNFEVILIDDGSTDGSSNIARRFERKCRNFYIYGQDNLGVAQARNLGLRKAKGEFIAFVDADDYIDKDYLLRLYTHAIHTKSDIVCCNFWWVHGKIKFKNYINYKHGIYDSLEAMDMLIGDTFMQSYLWNKLWRKELFKSPDITFRDMYFEDIATCPKLFYKAEKVTVISDVLYYYTQRKDSILHQYSLQTQADYLKAFVLINNFIYTYSLGETLGRAYTFLSYKVRLVMLSSLLMLHIKKHSFRTLFHNYRITFRILNLCRSPIDDNKVLELLKENFFI